MKESFINGETLSDDRILELNGGRLLISDCIFEYSNDKFDIEIQGDVNRDLLSKYEKADSDVFSITLGKSQIFNSEVNDYYFVYRLIDICF